MRTRWAVSMSAALLAVVFTSSAAFSQTAAASVCKDGTTSAASGKGACSGHGGVDAKATAAASKAAKAAAKTAAQVTCTDGTLSKGGQGACSGHGGIKGSAAATVAPTLPAKVPATSPARAKSEAKSKAATATQTPPPAPAAAKAAPAATKAASKRGEDNDPTDALAQCKDGMYSHAANRRGACSRHGGVAKFLKP
jgi:hypothetical protein